MPYSLLKTGGINVILSTGHSCIMKNVKL